MQTSTRKGFLVLWIFVTLLVFQKISISAAPFPLAQTVALARTNCAAIAVKPTPLRRADYLEVIHGIVHFFQHFQNSDGTIVDPFLHREVQYSTPCYAWAAAALIQGKAETNLLPSAIAALEKSWTELAEAKTADGHGDFFTFPAMLAYESLRDRMPAERRRRLEELIRAVNPERAYRDTLRPDHKQVHNWNVVALSGEFLRHQDGFAPIAFVERHLSNQLGYFTACGMYQDPNTPMAYDHFPRHFLAAILERGYDGQSRAELDDLLGRGAWASLLMQSPLGELPTGGRSAQHQWNEAEQCVTYEIWARRMQRAGNLVGAGAFKKAAHLSLQSVRRWVRPSGELWIVKNYFDPALRHGFESYSSHSQYNLLAASMLATAWQFADESIPERPAPADVGGFVFEVPEFHKIFANAGGFYLEIDAVADPHYNSTGLIRVHRAGVAGLAGPSDSTPGEKFPAAIGIAWPDKSNWKSLASLRASELKKVELTIVEQQPNRVRFTTTYELVGQSIQKIIEEYDLTPSEVKIRSRAVGPCQKIQLRWPVLTFDGRNGAQIETTQGEVRTALGSSQATLQLHSGGKDWTITARAVTCRNGFMDVFVTEISGNEASYSIRLGSAQK